jgi:hypothetical protein
MGVSARSERDERDVRSRALTGLALVLQRPGLETLALYLSTNDPPLQSKRPRVLLPQLATSTGKPARLNQAGRKPAPATQEVPMSGRKVDRHLQVAKGRTNAARHPPQVHRSHAKTATPFTQRSDTASSAHRCKSATGATRPVESSVERGTAAWTHGVDAGGGETRGARAPPVRCPGRGDRGLGQLLACALDALAGSVPTPRNIPHPTPVPRSRRSHASSQTGSRHLGAPSHSVRE